MRWHSRTIVRRWPINVMKVIEPLYEFLKHTGFVL